MAQMMKLWVFVCKCERLPFNAVFYISIIKENANISSYLMVLEPKGHKHFLEVSQIDTDVQLYECRCNHDRLEIYDIQFHYITLLYNPRVLL